MKKNNLLFVALRYNQLFIFLFKERPHLPHRFLPK